MIKIENLTKCYKEGAKQRKVLNQINLHIQSGEYVSLMGASGSGKSTLLNIIGFLDRPSAGEYLFNGANVARLSGSKLSQLRNRQTGFVFQNFQLLPRENVYNNVKLPLIYDGYSFWQRKKKVMQALNQVGMAQRIKSKPTLLSGGEKQKVAIARAIVNNPQLLLADEPTGNLDQQSTQEILRIFKELHQRGTTIILVTHDPLVAATADRMIRIEKGDIHEAID